MNKILSTLLVGLFAVSINAFAKAPVDNAPAVEAAATAKAEVKHTAAPAKKAKHKKSEVKKATPATPATPGTPATPAVPATPATPAN